MVGATASSCGKDEDDAQPQLTTEEAAAAVTSQTLAEGMTFEKFSQDCQTRGGLVQTHAACSGSNTCQGMSYNKFSHMLSEHTCRAINSCGGMSCVELLKDDGKAGDVVYKESCGECHSNENSTFKVFVPKGADGAAAEAAFKARSSSHLTGVVAFGTLGMNSNGTAFANMPQFYKRLSRPATERVVEFIKTLTPKAEEYETLGL